MRIGYAGTVCLLASCIGGSAIGQTVQLPTLHSFSTTGTVIVPDQGGAFLGGIRRGATGSVRRGIPGIGGVGSSIGRQMSSGNATVHVTIIDQQQLDQDVLAAARRSGNPEKSSFSSSPNEDRRAKTTSLAQQAPRYRPLPNELGGFLRQHNQANLHRRGVGLD